MSTIPILQETPQNKGVFATILSVFSNYSNFQGRSSASDYWIWIGFNYCVLSLLWFVLQVFTPSLDPLLADDIRVYEVFDGLKEWALSQANAQKWYAIISGCWGFVTLLPSFALYARRIHDVGYSAKYLILLMALPLLNYGQLYMILADSDTRSILDVASCSYGGLFYMPLFSSLNDFISCASILSRLDFDPLRDFVEWLRFDIYCFVDEKAPIPMFVVINGILSNLTPLLLGLIFLTQGSEGRKNKWGAPAVTSSKLNPDYRAYGLARSFKEAFSKCFDFRGRSTCSAYWMWYLANATMLSLVWGLGYLIRNVIVDKNSFATMLEYDQFYTTVAMSLTLVTLTFFIPNWSMTVRRLHDIGLSGWYAIIGLIPLVGNIILMCILARDSEPFDNRWGKTKKYISKIEYEQYYVQQNENSKLIGPLVLKELRALYGEGEVKLDDRISTNGVEGWRSLDYCVKQGQLHELHEAMVGDVSLRGRQPLSAIICYILSIFCLLGALKCFNTVGGEYFVALFLLGTVALFGIAFYLTKKNKKSPSKF